MPAVEEFLILAVAQLINAILYENVVLSRLVRFVVASQLRKAKETKQDVKSPFTSIV